MKLFNFTDKQINLAKHKAQLVSTSDRIPLIDMKAYSLIDINCKSL